MLKLESREDFIVTVPAYCNLPFAKLILSSTGEVSMCCHQLTQLGRLTDNTDVLDLWNSPLAKKIRSVTEAGGLHQVCSSWNSCPFLIKKREVYECYCYRRQAYPMSIEICLPDSHCNIGGESPDDKNPACIMCKRNWDKPHQPNLFNFLCSKTKPIMPYLRQISLLGIAEPFWRDAVFQMYENLEFWRYRHQCEFATNTNVICLTEKVTRRFFEETTLSSLGFSFDAASPEVFRKIRRLNAYELVLENAKRYLKMRDEYGGKKNHKVRIYNNINLLNIDEMTKMVETAADLGIDSMTMLPTYNQQGIVQLGELMLCDKNVKLFKKASEDAMKRAKELGINLHYSSPFDVVPPPVEDLVQLNFP